ncbi:HPr family phosphocarrier protein [Pseudolysinimonas sp.]|uniref:HPr family phosphocarrier protein n=1 Tax=Pseudolysinimonas sp. TaxID=2680009 RepID=UPI003F808B1D
MPERRVRVAARSGLHARPAALFSAAAAALGASVTVVNARGTEADAASILGLLTLGVPFGEEVVLRSESEHALGVLGAMLERDLDDE